MSVLVIRAPSAGGGGGGGGGSAPQVLYTDRVSGPVSDIGDGSGINGIWLRIYGLNFGAFADYGSTASVTIGGVTVGGYVYLQDQRVYTANSGFPHIQCLCVKVGSLSGLTLGTAYQITVTTANGSSQNNDLLGNALTFTPNPGDVYYVSNTAGSESTWVKNDITHPARYAQNYNGGTSGAVASTIWSSGNLKPGDTIVLLNTGTVYNDQKGYEGRFMRFNQETGSAPTGSSGTGYIHLTAHPGAVNSNSPGTVEVQSPATTGIGCIMGCGTTNAGTNHKGRYFGVSALKVSCASGGQGATDSGAINMQNGANFWRVVDNEITWPSTSTGAAHQKNGAISGNGQNSCIYGNYIHDVSGGDSSNLENHGIYLDGDQDSNSNNLVSWDWDIAFNYVKSVTTGTLFQLHNQVSTAPVTFKNINLHNNWFDTSGKYGINFDAIDSNSTGLKAWNNIVQGSFRNGMRVAPNSSASGYVVDIENNTFYDCYRDSTGSYPGMYSQENGTATGTINVKNNIFALASGRSNTNVSYVQDDTSRSTFGKNQYFDYKTLVTSKYSGDSTGQYGDPKFTTPGTDFSLQGTSPALAFAGSGNIAPSYDFMTNAQPRSGNVTRSVGAMA